MLDKVAGQSCWTKLLDKVTVGRKEKKFGEKHLDLKKRRTDICISHGRDVENLESSKKDKS